MIFFKVLNANTISTYQNVSSPGYLMPGFEINAKPINGFVVATVEQTNDETGLSIGEYVHGFLPWQEYNVADAKVGISWKKSSSNMFVGIYLIPNRAKLCFLKAVRRIDTSKAPPSAYLGVLGVTGLSAYFPCRDIGQPKAGETAFISAAAGGVGSIAGQILKQKGCKVFGCAGTDEKLAYVTGILGFDGAMNYKVSDEELDRQIGELCPDGVSVL